jgi:hypothetical protein
MQKGGKTARAEAPGELPWLSEKGAFKCAEKLLDATHGSNHALALAFHICSLGSLASHILTTDVLNSSTQNNKSQLDHGIMAGYTKLRAGTQLPQC